MPQPLKIFIDERSKELPVLRIGINLAATDSVDALLLAAFEPSDPFCELRLQASVAGKRLA